MNIEKQKEVATELLHILEGADPACILAGGAPRDWFLGKEANDLDFYIYDENSTEWMDRLRWKRLGLSMIRLNRSAQAEEYATMEHLRKVYDGEYKGMKFQVMIMAKPTFQSVVPMFGASVCEAWWKGNEIEVTANFLLSIYCKTIYIKSGYEAKESHIQKMEKYFPNFGVLPVSCVKGAIDNICQKQNIYPSSYNILELLKRSVIEK